MNHCRLREPLNKFLRAPILVVRRSMHDSFSSAPRRKLDPFATHIQRLLILLLALAFLAAPFANASDEEWSELDRISDYDPRGSIQRGQQDIRNARDRGDKKAELRALNLLSSAMASLDETQLNAENEKRGEELARELGDIDALCWYMDGRAWVLAESGNLDAANKLWDEATALAEKHNLNRRKGSIYLSRSAAAIHGGYKAEAMDWSWKAYNLSEARNDEVSMSQALRQIGDIYGGPLSPPEDQAKAADYLLRAFNLVDTKVYRLRGIQLTFRIGLTYLRRNDAAKARQYFNTILPLSHALGIYHMEAALEFHLGELDRGEGRYAEALAHFEKAVALFVKIQHKWHVVRSRLAQAEMLAQLGQKKESMETVALAKAMLPEINLPSIEVTYYPQAAKIYAHLKEHERAYQEMLALREADQRLAGAMNAKLGNELRVRFDVQLKESENALLRSQQKEAESRRLALILALALSIFLLISVAYYLRKRASAAKTEAAYHQSLATVEAKRAEALQAANSTLEYLANAGHEITASLDAKTVYAALYNHAKALFDISSVSIWMVKEDQLHLRFSTEGTQDESICIDNPTSIIARAARESQEVMIDNARDDENAATSTGKTSLNFALQAGGNVIGVLSIETKAQVVGERERQILRTLSAYGAVALSNAAHAQQLRAANQAKSTFLANMSHELRSPLNAMLGFTRLLLRDAKVPGEAKNDLDVVLRSGEHLYTLINQVLDLSKIEAGHATLNESEFDLYALLDELGEMFSVTAGQKGVQLAIDATPDVPRYIGADAVKLRQVLINLLSNAVKFTAAGGVTLRVAGRSGDGASCRLSFAVIDTGAGIAADELPRLGAAFTQAAAGQHAKEGTGLGLAISRNFVQLMGGELTLSSELNHGTTIAFTVPARRVARAPTAADSAGRTVVGLAPNQPQYRLLAVDDRQEGRQLLTRLLQPLGFAVREASNGREAVELCDAWAPHLIFMDMRMPVMDGREATRRIKASPKGKETVIIALTASSFEAEREEILKLGCDEFMRKPFREADLFDALHKHLGVEFVYADAPAPRATAATLTALPAELAGPLKKAIDELDMNAVENAIEAIRASNAPFADALSKLAKGFEYRRMLELLDNNGDQK